jgi:phage protein U
MWAQIGPIRIEIISPIEEMGGQHGADFPQIDVLEGKPRLQWMGAALTTYRLNYHLHCGMTRSPQQQFEMLKQMMDDHKAVAFVMGTGKYMGTFVVTQLTDDHKFMSDRGGMIEMSGEITLLEYAFESAEEELKQKAAAQKKSILTPALPVAVPTVTKLPIDTPSGITQAINGVNETVKDIVGTISETTNTISSSISSITTPFQEALGTLSGSFNPIMQVFGNATGELTNLSGALSTITGGKYNLNNVLTKVNNVSNTVTGGINSGQTVLGVIGSAANSMGSIVRQAR